MLLQIDRSVSPRELRLSGELDVSNAGELARVLGAMSGTGDISIDAASLAFMDVAGLRVLDHTAGRLEGSLLLHCPVRIVRRLLECTSFGRSERLRALESGPRAEAGA